MKSVIVAFLLICVVQVFAEDSIEIVKRPSAPVPNYRLPQNRDSYLEIIENIAKQTIQLAIDAVKVIQSRIEQLFQTIYEKLFGIQQIANNALDGILHDFESIYENDRNNVIPCVESHVDEVRSIIKKGREDISKCIVTSMDDANKLSDQLMPYVESIRTLIRNITGVVDKCSSGSNTVTIALCITQHVTEVSNAISGIIHDAQEAIKLASVKISANALNTQACVKTSVDAVKVEVEKVVAAVKECIANTP